MRLDGDWSAGWLVCTAGIFYRDGDGSWCQAGGYGFRFTDLIRDPQRLVASAGNGLWQAPRTGGAWSQLHDETVTEVQAIGAVPGDPGVVVASAYGVAVGARDELGAARWTSCSDALRVNERYSNAILVDPANSDRWLVGTEAGVLVATDSGRVWERSSLIGRPVRALCYHQERYWAGSDEGGVWTSSDALTWERAGSGLEADTVFSLASSDGRLLVGTERGVAVGDGGGAWKMTAPQMRVSALAAHPEETSHWMAGGSPSGLWSTEDDGLTWQQHAGFNTVEAILPPES